MVENLIPENDLEDLLIKTEENKIDFEEFISFFLKADMYVPSGSKVMSDGIDLTPLLFEKNEVQMAGVFTALSRSNLFKDKAPYCLSMKGREFLQNLVWL